jgi:hypothetical protein
MTKKGECSTMASKRNQTFRGGLQAVGWGVRGVGTSVAIALDKRINSLNYPSSGMEVPLGFARAIVGAPQRGSRENRELFCTPP